jgi:DUF2911 family protein
MSMRRSGLLAFAVLAAAAAPLAAQAPNKAAFVALLGKDTLFVDQYTRRGNHVTGDLVQRQPATVVTHYAITLDPSGRVATVELGQRRADGTAGPNFVQAGKLTFAKDTVAIEVTRDTTVRRRVAATGAFPTLGPSVGLTEVILSQLKRSKSDSVDVNVVNLGSQRPNVIAVKFFGDSARVWSQGYAIHYALDKQGRVTGVNGQESTQKYEARRVAAVDIPALAKGFAAADAAGKGFGGPASPRDTARAAGIWVDYSRPALRGRDVWKNGVLGDTLWRTGANAATQFHTDADLVVGGQTIPAGTYTLWTHTMKDGSQYELVFNKQTGQWGTEHHAEQDLVRVPLTVSPLSPPAERFTIAVDDAAIKLLWGSQQLATSYTKK